MVVVPPHEIPRQRIRFVNVDVKDTRLSKSFKLIGDCRLVLRDQGEDSTKWIFRLQLTGSLGAKRPEVWLNK